MNYKAMMDRMIRESGRSTKDFFEEFGVKTGVFTSSNSATVWFYRSIKETKDKKLIADKVERIRAAFEKAPKMKPMFEDNPRKCCRCETDISNTHVRTKYCKPCRVVVHREYVKKSIAKYRVKTPDASTNTAPTTTLTTSSDPAILKVLIEIRDLLKARDTEQSFSTHKILRPKTLTEKINLADLIVSKSLEAN